MGAKPRPLNYLVWNWGGDSWNHIDTFDDLAGVLDLPPSALILPRGLNPNERRIVISDGLLQFSQQVLTRKQIRELMFKLNGIEHNDL